MKKVLMVVGAALAMAACSEASTAPMPRKAGPSNAAFDLTCRSGYVVAYDSNGNPYCAPASGSNATRQP